MRGHLATQRAGAESGDWAHVVLAFGTRRAVLHAGMLGAGGTPRFTVHGTRGSLVTHGLDPQEAQLRRGLRPGDAGWGVDASPLQVFDGSDAAPRALALPQGAYGRYDMELRNAIRGHGGNPVTPAQAVAVMAVLETAAISAARGAARPLPLTESEHEAWAAAI